jgi:hypothetical protein
VTIGVSIMRMGLHHVHGMGRVGLMDRLGMLDWLRSCRLSRRLKLCDMRLYDLGLPFLQQFSLESCAEVSGRLTFCNSARTSSETPNSSNSDFIEAITSSMTER